MGVTLGVPGSAGVGSGVPVASSEGGSGVPVASSEGATTVISDGGCVPGTVVFPGVSAGVVPSAGCEDVSAGVSGACGMTSAASTGCTGEAANSIAAETYRIAFLYIFFLHIFL